MHVTHVGLRRTRLGSASTLSRARRCSFWRISRQWMRDHVLPALIHHLQGRSYNLRSQISFLGRTVLTHWSARTGPEQVIAENQDHRQSNHSAYASSVHG